jgi:holo-[acyl-carrier protein] synthase
VIVGFGLDVVAVARLERLLSGADSRARAERFLDRCFTAGERAYCDARRDRATRYAARFAAKEAVMKALGTGARGVAWREIEVLPNRRGKPLLYLYGRARERAGDIGLHSLDVSLSHTREHALAIVVGVQEAGIDEPGVARERLLRWLQERGRR